MRKWEDALNMLEDTESTNKTINSILGVSICSKMEESSDNLPLENVGISITFFVYKLSLLYLISFFWFVLQGKADYLCTVSYQINFMNIVFWSVYDVRSYSKLSIQFLCQCILNEIFATNMMRHLVAMYWTN